MKFARPPYELSPTGTINISINPDSIVGVYVTTYAQAEAPDSPSVSYPSIVFVFSKDLTHQWIFNEEDSKLRDGLFEKIVTGEL